MYIWLALLIPVLITAAGWWFNKKRYTLWEIFVPFGITLVLILITKGLINLSERSFTEYWGSHIETVYENEPYNVWDHETCYRRIPTGRDANGHTTYTSIPYDCSHQDDYGPSWSAKTNIKEEFRIDESQFDAYQKLFGTNKIVIGSRINNDSRDKCTGSRGTKFEGKPVGVTSYQWAVNWKGSDETMVPVFSKHTYINKIKSSDLSKFNMERIKRKTADSLHLFKYPEFEDKFTFPTILGENIPSSVQEKFQRLNGKFGPTNELRLWVLVFNNHDPYIAKQQEDYWVRGNMNELTICIGVDEQKRIEWTYAFSWTKNQDLVADVEYQAEKLKVLNDSTWNSYYQYLNTHLNTFQRRDFEKEFNYLTVEPKGWHMVVIFIISIISSILTNMWVINNEYEQEEETRRRFNGSSDAYR